MDRFEVIYYETEEGTQPARDFIDALPVKLRVKVARSIDLLSVAGTLLREPDSKPLRDGIFELRTKLESEATRILYFFTVGRTIVLTNGFVKTTRRTPHTRDPEGAALSRGLPEETTCLRVTAFETTSTR